MPPDRLPQEPNHAGRVPDRVRECHKAADAWTQAASTTHDVSRSSACTPRRPAACHKNGVYKGTPRACVACHQADYSNAEPQPRGGGVPDRLRDCHKASDTAWTQATFNHATTAFPLVGVHATQTCQRATGTASTRARRRACVSCHQADYTSTHEPEPRGRGVPDRLRELPQGHGPTLDAGESSTTARPRSRSSACTPRRPASLPRERRLQGQADRLRRVPPDRLHQHQEPQPRGLGVPTTCESCHKASDTAWTRAYVQPRDHGVPAPRRARHADLPGLPQERRLQGHADAPASRATRPTTPAPANPNHAAAGFPTTCEQLPQATDTSWTQGSLQPQHDRVPARRRARHADLPALPRGWRLQRQAHACVSCHQTDYTTHEEPEPRGRGVPDRLRECHKASDTSWTRASFNHSTTAFPLAGVHATQTCQRCHGDGVYNGKSTACVSCHQTDYTNTRNPNHAASGFPTACESCHKASDTSWTQGVFNHSTTAFPLLGAHATQTCQRCHGDGVYNGKSTACVSCHQTDYTNTRNPNHIAAGFPTACETCHRASDTSWSQGTFNHTRFPIASGRHAGNPCSACHPNPSSYAVFSCTTACHPRSETDSHHRGRQGYVYDSQACYSCHPTGRGD